MNKINSFRNEYAFLSNFFESPVTYDGITYRNSESAFQAQKCENKEDRLQFADLNPSEAKHLGRHVPLRKDWESVKIELMRDIVREKFRQNPDLLDKLLDTGNVYLEEGNDWGDKIWGIVNGNGRNLLGFTLMELRDEFAAERNELEDIEL